jgi:hypothetical protein
MQLKFGGVSLCVGVLGVGGVLNWPGRKEIGQDIVYKESIDDQ